MTIKDIVKKFTAGEIDYGQAVAEAKHISMSEDDLENVILTLDKIREALRAQSGGGWADNRDTADHSPNILMGFVPNEVHDDLILKTMSQIQEGMYPQLVIENLEETYHLSGSLAAYFFSEAESRVRLKMISEEEFEMIGKQWDILQKTRGRRRSKNKEQTL
jgi:hypothetical protein